MNALMPKKLSSKKKTLPKIKWFPEVLSFLPFMIVKTDEKP